MRTNIIFLKKKLDTKVNQMIALSNDIKTIKKKIIVKQNYLLSRGGENANTSK